MSDQKRLFRDTLRAFTCVRLEALAWKMGVPEETVRRLCAEERIDIFRRGGDLWVRCFRPHVERPHAEAKNGN